MKPEDVHGLDGGELRRMLARLEDENGAMVERINGSRTRFAIKDAGFDPGSGEGRAIAKLYDGDPDPDAVRRFAAANFGWHPDEAAPDLSQQIAQQRADGEERLRMLGQGALPVRDPSENEELARAEAEGDWDTYNRLQMQKLDRARRGREYQRSAGR